MRRVLRTEIRSTPCTKFSADKQASQTTTLACLTQSKSSRSALDFQKIETRQCVLQSIAHVSAWFKALMGWGLWSSPVVFPGRSRCRFRELGRGSLRAYLSLIPTDATTALRNEQNLGKHPQKIPVRLAQALNSARSTLKAKHLQSPATSFSDSTLLLASLAL